MNKYDWLMDRGYRYDAHLNQYHFRIRIFEYGAMIAFNEWDITRFSLEEIQARHDEFIRRALNREQF